MGRHHDGSVFGACFGAAPVLQIRHMQTGFGLSESCQAPAVKRFLFTGIPIYVISPPSPCHREGRFAIVTKRGAGCDGPLPASGVLHPTKRRRRTAKSCGPGAATLASIRPACAGPATGARKAVPRGEREVSRQTIARGRPGCPGRYLSNPCALLATHCTRCLRVPPAPGLPCALYPGGSNEIAKLRRKLRRENESACLQSLPELVGWAKRPRPP